MKLLYFLIALLMAPVVFPEAYSQSRISGHVQESEGKALPFANVLLLSARDSTLIKGVVTNETGDFVLEKINPKSYLLFVSMIGYQSHYALLQIADKDTQVGTIRLKEDLQQLNEVVVQAKKMLYEQKIDRLILNISGSSVLAGGTAWEVLKRSPGLIVDDAKGTINMNGKNGVLVLINGKPTNASLEVVLSRLRGMSAGNIDRIELLHSPPAQYDAEGNAGAINIVLKKNTDEGFNGTMGLSVSYGRFNSQKGSLDFNWHQGRMNLFGSMYILEGMGYNNYLEHDRSFIIDPVQYASANQQYIHHNPQKNGGVQVGLDYELSPKTRIGLMGNMGYNVWGMRSDSKTISYAGTTLTDSILSKVESTTITTYAYGNVNLTHRFNPKHELNLDGDYAYYLLSNPGRTQISFEQSQSDAPKPDFIDVDKKTPFHIWVGKGDYSWNLSRGQTLKMGLKTTNTGFENRLTVASGFHERQEKTLSTTTEDHISEQTHAAYASAHLSPAPKWFLQAGLRYEYNIYRIQAFEENNNYLRRNGRWFPTFFFTHTIDSTHQLQFSYNRRINRPSYSQLAAYFIFLDPYQIVTGNPRLLPAYTDALSLTYSWKSVLFTLRYSRENNAILWRNIVDLETRVQVNQQHNFDSYQLASFTVALPLRPARWWDIQFSTTAEHRSIRDREGREFGIHLTKAHLLGNITQTFSLPWQLKLEMIGNFTTAYLDGEQARSARGALDVGLQKQLTRKGGHLSLTLIDIFNSANWMDWNFLQKEYAVRTYGIFQFSQRHLRLSYSHPFGNQKVKTANKRSTASEEERRRAGG
jgi:outer membrane receptor protein involved in Fe transport